VNQGVIPGGVWWVLRLCAYSVRGDEKFVLLFQCQTVQRILFVPTLRILYREVKGPQPAAEIRFRKLLLAGYE